MPGLENFDCEGTLTIGGVSMNRPAWSIQGNERGNGGLLQLLTTVDVRGSDRIVPGANGVIPFRRRQTASRYSFRLVVAGDVDSNGNPVVGTATEGLEANLDFLWTNVIDPPNTTTGTRVAVWTKPSGGIVQANVHIIRCEGTSYALGTDKAIWEGRLVISSPSGRFA